VSRTLRALGGLVLVATLTLAALAARQVQTVDVTTLGPQVGQKAIPFQLPDQHGKARTLASVAGPKGTMLVFFRSSDW
jgi:cytochrome oxidase Cu insertion factor (SCO1/SenC/PrrC family)